MAAGIKLVPLIFIPYLVAAGKLRQAAAATATLAATIGIGYVFLPQESDKWWLTGYFLSSGRVAHGSVPLNQSLLALLARLTGGLAAAMPIWRVAAVVVGLLGVAAAALLHRSGRPVQGWVTCALTGLLVSPISWDHHWVWILPILAVMADLAVRASGAARWGYWILGAATVIVFGDLGPRLGALPPRVRPATPSRSSLTDSSWPGLDCLCWRCSPPGALPSGTRAARGAWRLQPPAESRRQGTSDLAWPGRIHHRREGIP